jgi:hypothetical protein
MISPPSLLMHSYGQSVPLLQDNLDRGASSQAEFFLITYAVKNWLT